jgi:hypothetical protein
MYREDDTNWPKKNIVGKQELEIRVGNDHISFEVCLASRASCVHEALTVSLDGEDWLARRHPG